VAGRIYASAADGVRIYEPTGAQVGEIPLPGAVNFTFGGRDRDVLFITADDAIWVAALDIRS
jgi:gluconolactonase